MMLKTMMIAACAAVALSAMAQDSPYGGQWMDNDKVYTDGGTITQWDMHKAVLKQDRNLQGGDKYFFETMLNRMQSNDESALVAGLFHARREAIGVYNQMCAAAIPADWQGPGVTIDVVASVNDEDGMRPMKMIMQAPKPHDIDYNTAIDLLCNKLNDTQTTQLRGWWANADDRSKDVCVRLLKQDAMKADDPIYVSTLCHRTYTLTPQ